MLLKICSVFILLMPSVVAGRVNVLPWTFAPAECAIVDKSLASVHVTLERMDESRKIGILRFQNNLTCPVIIETQDMDMLRYGELFKRDQKGVSSNSQLKNVFDWTKKSRPIPVLYDVEEWADSCNAPRPANYSADRDQKFYLPIPAGEWVLLEVDSNYLRDGRTISVPFRYSWEESKNADFVRNRAYLNIADAKRQK